MSELNALVVFYSRYGATEKLALAGGLGAVQNRANLRLRRLKDFASEEEIQRDAIWQDNLERMNREYIAPREIDTQWADVIILAVPKPHYDEMRAYLESLKEVHGKIAAVLSPSHPLCGAAGMAGLTVVPCPASQTPEDATAFAKSVCERARVLKVI